MRRHPLRAILVAKSAPHVGASVTVVSVAPLGGNGISGTV
jgi:hypothetical protein